MQSIFLPAMAIAFATGPIAGQNYGAQQFGRVRETFSAAAKVSTVLMLALMLCTQWRPEWLVHGFTQDPAVVEVGSHFLRIASFNFVASGLIFTCSGIFQGLGHTWPALAATASRIVTFMLPAIWLSTTAGLPDRTGLVRVRRERVDAGGDQLRAAQADDAGAASGRLKPRACR